VERLAAFPGTPGRDAPNAADEVNPRSGLNGREKCRPRIGAPMGDSRMMPHGCSSEQGSDIAQDLTRLASIAVREALQPDDPEEGQGIGCRRVGRGRIDDHPLVAVG
jgi:hypothetical protein